MKFEKTYLSRAMTRSMSLDYPIGDPTGGPAYGERRDPVSAVMAVASMWEAGTIIAGASSVMAGFEALTVAQGLMYAGGALSLVGNVSGNKNLMVLGSVVSLTGGYGRFFADSGSAFNQTFSEAFSSTPAAPAANLVNSPVSSDLALGAQNVNTQDSTTDALTTNTAKGVAAATPPATAASAAPTPKMDGQSYFPPAPAALAAPVTPAAPVLHNAQFDKLYPPPPGSSPVDTGIINKAMAFAKENPMAAMVLGQAAGGVATGVMDMATGKTAAQTQQLTADAAYRQSVADKYNKETALQATRIAQLNANLKAQYPQMTVNPGAVTMGQPQPAGLINTARA